MNFAEIGVRTREGVRWLESREEELMKDWLKLEKSLHFLILQSLFVIHRIVWKFDTRSESGLECSSNRMLRRSNFWNWLPNYFLVLIRSSRVAMRYEPNCCMQIKDFRTTFWIPAFTPSFDPFRVLWVWDNRYPYHSPASPRSQTQSNHKLISYFRSGSIYVSHESVSCSSQSGIVSENFDSPPLLLYLNHHFPKSFQPE